MPQTIVSDKPQKPKGARTCPVCHGWAPDTEFCGEKACTGKTVPAAPAEKAEPEPEAVKATSSSKSTRGKGSK